MTDKLTEIKSKLQEATDLIKEYELLEEARRRGFVNGAKFKGMSDFEFEVRGELFIQQGGHGAGNIYSRQEDGCIYCAIDNKWAEIIPEEEKKDELKVNVWDWIVTKDGETKQITDDDMMGLKYEDIERLATEDEILEAKFPEEKSLHDQIREGGWDKVFELSGVEFQVSITAAHSDVIVKLTIIKDKVRAYHRLLALSKVLNEGKKREQFIYTVVVSDEGLETDICSSSSSIIFYSLFDTQFALDFAEKEWKIFYNSNQ